MVSALRRICDRAVEVAGLGLLAQMLQGGDVGLGEAGQDRLRAMVALAVQLLAHGGDALGIARPALAQALLEDALQVGEAFEAERLGEADRARMAARSACCAITAMDSIAISLGFCSANSAICRSRLLRLS